jgi:hypothetical protein
LFGLWTWDRRRRYLEQHPDIVRRRRARRALNRERRRLRKAARRKDAPTFATSAVNAMRVACAPHYPAEARALVGADIIPILETDSTQPQGDLVRRFFALTDAVRFGKAAPNGHELLSLEPQLEQVLDQLEAKL